MKNILAFFSVCLLLCTSSWATVLSEKTANHFSLTKLQNIYRAAESMEADFVQEVYQASLARTKSSSGNIRVAKPNKIRWETYKPDDSVMVSDGVKLWYFNPKSNNGKGQVIEHSARDLASQPIYQILTGQAELTKEFEVLKITKEHGIAKGAAISVVSLKPRHSMGDLETVQITVDANSLILSILLENKSGNHTRISLQNQKLGSKLPPVLFNFKAPAEAEIVK